MFVLLRQLLLLLSLLLSSTANNGLKFAAISGRSPFFHPVEEGWNDTCRLLELDCTYIVPNGNYTVIDAVYDLAYNQNYDGIAMAPAGNLDTLEDLLANITQDRGIPFVTFDSDLVNSTRSAYIGTDNVFMGRTMARLLKQLRPEGGSFVIIAGKEERDEGFIEEILKDNHREDRGQWTHIHDESIIYPGGGAPGFAQVMEQYAIKYDPTAMIFMRQTPMRYENWTQFVDRYRNITYIGTDGSDYQLSYLNRRYVDGLIGQLPYDMGAFSAQTLWELATMEPGADRPIKEKIPTNLVAYNLIPLELPRLDVDQHLLGNLKYIGYTCFGIVVAFALSCMVWTTMHRSDLVVTAAQPFFLQMVATGVLIMSGSLIPLSMDDNGEPDEMSDAKSIGICMSIPWLSFIGFTVTFSALFSKTWRINKLFAASGHFRRLRISKKQTLLPFLALLTCNIIVLVCWTVIDPLTYERELSIGTDFWNREIASYGTCRSEQSSLPYLIPLGIINLSLLAIAAWQAFEARGIQSEFAETKYIALGIFSLGQAFLTGIPIVAVVRDMPEAYYLVLCFTIFVLCMVILALIFLPKMVLQRAYATMPASEQRKVLMQRSIRSKSIIGTAKSRKSDSWTTFNHGFAPGSVQAIDKSSEMLNDSARQLQNRVTDIRNETTNSSVSSTKTGTTPTPHQTSVRFPVNSVDRSYISSLGHSILEEVNETATTATFQSEREKAAKEMVATQGKAAEERFEALEKVKGFLTASEYNEKKKEILSSI